jgi:hypothetical protein
MRVDYFLCGLLSAIAVAFPLSNAWAYLDPGTGSFLLQMLLGGIAGLAVVGRMYWARFKVLIGRTFAGSNKDAENDR